MEKYLISTMRCVVAVRIAKDLGLKRSEWEHVPFEGAERQKQILGRRASEDKYLIGDFSNREKEYLLPKNI